jgi:hypothetical protein
MLDASHTFQAHPAQFTYVLDNISGADYSTTVNIQHFQIQKRRRGTPYLLEAPQNFTGVYCTVDG